MIIDEKTFEALYELKETQEIFLSGDIIKFIEPQDELQKVYLFECITLYKNSIRNRLSTSQLVLKQNLQLVKKETILLETLEQLRIESEAVKEEKNRTKEILVLTERDKVSAEQQVEILKTSKKLDILNRGLLFSMIAIFTIIVSVTLIQTAFLYKNLETDQIIGNVFNIYNILLTGLLTIVSSVLGVKIGLNNNKEEKTV